MADDPPKKDIGKTKFKEQKGGKWSDDVTTEAAGPFKPSKTADLESSDSQTTECESKELEEVLRHTQRLTLYVSRDFMWHRLKGEKSWQDTVLRGGGLSFRVMWRSTDDDTHLQVEGHATEIVEYTSILAPLCPAVEHLSIEANGFPVLRPFPHKPMPMKSVITVCLKYQILYGTLNDTLLAVTKSYPNAKILDLQLMHPLGLSYDNAHTHEIDSSSLRELKLRYRWFSDEDIRILSDMYPNVTVTGEHASQASHEDSKQGMGMKFKPERKTSPSFPHSPTSSIDGHKVHWDFLTDSRELFLQENEVVISCGIRFSPSGAKFSKPIKVTLDHNAHFTNPRGAEIVFYTRNKGSNNFVRIPASADGYPRCDVRAKDLDLYVDHFSIWWIVAVISGYFFGKKVNCRPYVRPPVTKGSTHLVLLCIYDDLSDVRKTIDKEMALYEPLHPPQLMIVEPKCVDINIELFEGLKKNEKKIDEKKIPKRDINHVDRKKISFAVRELASGESQKFLKFTLDQGKSLCSPTLIEFELRYDDVPTTTLSG